jgi:PAS domain S-box-containing protein
MVVRADIADHLQELLDADDSEFGFVLLDPDDILVYASKGLGQAFPGVDIPSKLYRPYAEVLGALITAGTQTGKSLPPEDQLASHLKWHEDPKYPLEVLTNKGQWIRYRERRLKGGYTAGVFIDITDVKKRELALSTREQRLADYADAGSEWLWQTDEEHRYAYFSQGLLPHTGFSPEELIGKRRQDMIANVASSETLEHFATLEEHRPFQDFRYATKRHNGKTLYISVSGVPFFDKDGRFKGYRGVGQDVTPHVLAEQREEQAHARLSDAVNGLHGGILMFDQNERLIVTNIQNRNLYSGVAERIKVGIPMEEAVAALLQRDYEESSIPLTDEAISGELARWRSPQLSDLQFPLGDAWIERRVAPTKAGGALIMEIDVTALKRREQELELAKDEAERANRTRTQFMAQMSHELRTPLNSIIGFAEVIHDELYGELPSPKYKDFANDIRESGRHLLSIINDILDLAKGEAGQRTLNPEPVSVPEAAMASLKLVKQRADAIGLTLVNNIPNDLPAVLSEDKLVRQMLINLISNAVKFTESGGTVTVTAEPTQDGGLNIIVEDTGIGMEQGEIEQAMLPFTQIDSDLTRQYEGTGLGLPLVDSLMKLHDGLFLLESTVGVGTRASLCFPAKAVLAEADRPAETAQST